MTHTVRRRIERASDAKRELRAAEAERGWRSSVFFLWIEGLEFGEEFQKMKQEVNVQHVYIDTI